MTHSPDDLSRALQDALGDAYTIERELGGGGMSRVFLAVERQLERRVVIKVLPPEMAAGLSVDRFRREIQLAARLQHPHIVPVLATGEAAGVSFFTMPFVEGRSLRERIQDGGPMPIREALGLLRNVAAALAYAHSQGVVHRDIKPDNVLVSHGAAAVTDFGVAKALSSARVTVAPGGASGTLTAIGTSLGTPVYMAPEQAAADPDTDHRADIYSFGVMSYEVLAGVPPFDGSPHALMLAHFTQQPPPLTARRPDVPPGLAAIVNRCLEKDPAQRPQTAAELVIALDDIPSGGDAARAPDARPSGSPTASLGTGRRTLLAGAALLALISAAAVRTRARTAETPNGAAPVGRAMGAADPSAAVTSLAVLPLVNVASDSADAYFSDGMTDELTSALSRVPGLRVASRTSTFVYRNEDRREPREIGRALGVGSLLTGRVRRSGSRLRVTAELTSVADGLVLWSETFERQLHDVFAIQDEIASSIAAALQVRLAGASSKAAPRRGTNNLEAYDLYLRGRYHFHRRGGPALQRAAQYFGQAIARDTGYAEAYAGLADAAALLPLYGHASADSAFGIARRAALRALALDSTLAEAHATLGLVDKSEGRWTDSERALRRSIALNAGYVPAHQWLGELYLLTNRIPESIAELRVASSLDPLSPIIAAEQAYTLALGGQSDAAYESGKRGIELSPELWTTHAFFGYACLFTGRAGKGLLEVEMAVRLDSSVTPLLGTLAYAYALMGDSTRARMVASRVVQLARVPRGSAGAAAIALAGIGDRAGALDWLERAIRQRDPWMYAMGLNAPFFDSVRSDARFAAAAAEMGLGPEGAP